MRTPFLPKSTTPLKLFFAGATVGPLVDSIHNQCLLEYKVLPVTVPSLDPAAEPILCTSWLIPPLLGVAYVVLGGILPRVMQAAVVKPFDRLAEVPQRDDTIRTASVEQLRTKAIVAVVTTALIIKLSELLQTQALVLSAPPSPDQNYGIMLLAALLQWIVLDGTPAAILAAGATSIGGPLSELPFVASGCWQYIPSAADYLPLSSFAENGVIDWIATMFLGDGYQDLALSSITGPCYFAVTMDSIALGRWFDAQDDDVKSTVQVKAH